VLYLANAGTNGGTPAMRRADGTGGTRMLFPPGAAWGQALETRDGKWLVMRRSVFEAGKGDIFAVRAGDTTLVPLAVGPTTEADAAVSPDGRWLAYASEESGVYEVYVRPFPDAASARWQVSAAGGTDPVWSRNGRELFYLSAQNEMTSVAVAPGAGFSFSPPKRLFSTAPYTPIPPVPSFDVSPDGKRFLLLRETTPTDRNELIVVQNWVEEMKARARAR
jgi:Tol biopolymer transport system component